MARSVTDPVQLELLLTVLLLLCAVCGVWGSQVVVPLKVSAVLGRNVTLGCRIEVDSNSTLVQSSWEKRQSSGSVTLAVYSPVFGVAVPPEYERRLSFRSPSTRDATIVLEDVGFADSGIYTCKVSTFPLGSAEASASVSVLLEPKVYVSAGSSTLMDGGNETRVATCTAERARPPADVSWEADLYGTSEAHVTQDGDGTTTQVHYDWQPARYAHGHTLTCVVKHPALQSGFRIPYIINVQFAPDIQVQGSDGDWYVGRENVLLKCLATANPPARLFRWSRLDADMPDAVVAVKDTLFFPRPLRRKHSGVYRCEVGNSVGLQHRDIMVRVQDRHSSTAEPLTAPVLLPEVSISVTVLDDKQRALSTAPPSAALHTDPPSTTATPLGDKQRALFTPPALLLHEGDLAGLVCGALFLLLVVGGVYYQRRRRTPCGDYNTRLYLGHSDTRPPEPQRVYGDEAGRVSPDSELEPSRDGDGSVYPDEDGEGRGYDRDYVFHADGSVISRREWYV